jgi:3-deoxy-D-manno-octulosonic-acid transferase
MRVLYSLLVLLLLPWALLHLLWRARRQPDYLRHVGERFGFFRESIGLQVIWLHCVSVGETRAAEPIVKALRERHPGHRILLTHVTPTGRETGEALFGDDVSRAYLPYDFPLAVGAFLRHFRPAAGIVLETEIWPNLVEHARRRNVPMYLVNARMSEKSARGYARFSALTRPALRGFARVAAQTEGDAARLATLGAEGVRVTGNVKFDRAAPPEAMALGADLRRMFGEQRRVFLAASTREGEEAVILDALARASLPEDTVTVIVPRHPQRFEEVAALFGRRGLRFRRRSENFAPAGDIRLVLGDSMGEMFAYYAACDVAFIGGSLLPLGGQNLLEACAVGRPVLVGPHTFNFEEATRGAIEAGAALRVGSADELAATLAQLLPNGMRRAEMSEAGRRFMERHRGATERTLALIKIPAP